MNLVEVQKREVVCDSSLVARKFNQKHKEVVKRIQFLCEDLRGVSNPPKFPIKEERIYRGREYSAYLMGREFFSLLVMRFKGKKALEWQVKFNKAFYAMEKSLLLADHNKTNQPYLEQRKQSVIVRKDTTDRIKEFVEYATNQGSKSAKFYYKHITNATYKALGLFSYKQPKLKDTLNIMELAWLMSAESVAQKSLSNHMISGEHYKAIFVLVRQDIESFARGLLINQIKEK